MGLVQADSQLLTRGMWGGWLVHLSVGSDVGLVKANSRLLICGMWWHAKPFVEQDCATLVQVIVWLILVDHSDLG